MTREEKNQHVEFMNDALCDLCSTYQDCTCDGCEFARYISVNGRAGTIITSTDMGDWIDMSVYIEGIICQVMMVDGKPVAICDDVGLVRLGDAKASDVADFASNYAEFDEEAWNDSLPCWWNDSFGCWEEVIGNAGK